MSYLQTLGKVTGVNQDLARVANVVGDHGGSTINSILSSAKATAKAEIPDSVGTLIGAGAGGILWRKHRVLGALVGASAGRNGPALLRPYDRESALRNIAVTGSGVAGALVAKKRPAVGFVLGWLVGSALNYYYGGSR